MLLSSSGQLSSQYRAPQGGTSIGMRPARRNAKRSPSSITYYFSLSIIVLGFLLAPRVASAQIALVHVTSCGKQAFPTSCTISSTGSGNLIVVGFQIEGGSNTATTISGVTDNAGN